MGENWCPRALSYGSPAGCHPERRRARPGRAAWGGNRRRCAGRDSSHGSRRGRPARDATAYVHLIPPGQAPRGPRRRRAGRRGWRRPDSRSIAWRFPCPPRGCARSLRAMRDRDWSARPARAARRSLGCTSPAPSPVRRKRSARALPARSTWRRTPGLPACAAQWSGRRRSGPVCRERRSTRRPA